MSESVLVQLKEAESQLAAQETELTAQLSTIQEQRKGLQTVIEMFRPLSGANGAAVSSISVGSAAVVPSAKAAMASPILAAPEADKTEMSDVADIEADADDLDADDLDADDLDADDLDADDLDADEEDLETSADELAAIALTPVRPTSAADKARKSRGGKSPNWQRYIQTPFKKTPLPDVVANILKAQPDDVFKIADVMEVIFKEDIPKVTFLKARNRVSNVLSAGARSGEWHRGRGGRYSLSARALQ